MSRWWWWPGVAASGDRAVLFFPPAGADQHVVQPLLPHLGGLRLGVLALPGRGPRHEEEPPADLPTLVEAVADATVRLGGPPPLLAGHSFGGLLAYAVAAALQERDRPVARLLALASSSPSAWITELAADRAAHPDDGRAAFAARRGARILHAGDVPDTVAAHPELRAQVLASASVDAGLAFDGFGTTRLSCPITAIRPRDDAWVPATATAGWAEVTSGGCEIIAVPGGHFFYRERPEGLATLLRMEAGLS